MPPGLPLPRPGPGPTAAPGDGDPPCARLSGARSATRSPQSRGLLSPEAILQAFRQTPRIPAQLRALVFHPGPLKHDRGAGRRVKPCHRRVGVGVDARRNIRLRGASNNSEPFRKKRPPFEGLKRLRGRSDRQNRTESSANSVRVNMTSLQNQIGIAIPQAPSWTPEKASLSGASIASRTFRHATGPCRALPVPAP